MEEISSVDANQEKNLPEKISQYQRPPIQQSVQND